MVEITIGVLLWIAQQQQYANELRAAGLSDEEVAVRLIDDAYAATANLWSVPQDPQWYHVQGFRVWKSFIKVRIQVPGINPAEYVWREEMCYFAWREVPGIPPPNNRISISATSWEKLLEMLLQLGCVAPVANPFPMVP